MKTTALSSSFQLFTLRAVGAVTRLTGRPVKVALTATATVLILSLCHRAQAAAYTFNGLGTDGYFTNTANWLGTAPANNNGHDFTYAVASGGQTNLTNNFTGNLYSQTFAAGCVPLTISETLQNLQGPNPYLVLNLSSSLQTLTGTLSVFATNSSMIASNGDLSLGALTIRNDLSNPVKIILDGAANGTVNGNITKGASNGGLIKQGTGTWELKGVLPTLGTNVNFINSGTLILSGANTTTSTNRIVGGTLVLNNAAALQSGLLDMNAADAGALEFGSAITATTLGGLQGSRNITLTNLAGSAVSLSVGNNNGSTAYTGVLGGPGGLTKVGTGAFTLSTDATFTGGAAVTNGYLVIDGLNRLSTVSGITVKNNGQLKGTANGSYANKPLTITGIGLANSQGALHFNVNTAVITWPGAITLSGNSRIGAFSVGGSYNFSSGIGGTGDLNFWAGGGATTHIQTFILNGAGSYVGNTTIEASFGANTIVQLGVNNALPSGTALTLNSYVFSSVQMLAELKLNGKNQELAGLTSTGVGIQRIVNGNATPSVLTLNNAATATYAGGLGGPNANENNLSLVKTGAGILNLNGATTNGANTYTGGTTISNGTVLAVSLGSGNVDVKSGAGLGAGIGNAVATLALAGNLTLTNSVLAYDITNLANGDKITVAGNLTPEGVTTIILSNPLPLAEGDYTLMDVAGALNGSAANFTVASAPAKSYTIVYTNSPSNRVLLHVVTTGAITIKTWVGDGLANQWDINTSTNWVETGGYALYKFADNDVITFDNIATNLNVNLTTAVSPATLVVNATKNYSFSGAGGIAGTNSLVKSGSGALTLATANTYNGGTIINAGTVALSGSGTLGNTSAALTVNTGTLNLGATSQTAGPVTLVNGTISNGILAGTSFVVQAGTISASLAGSGAALIKTSANNLTLAGTNTYTGGTTISNGILLLASPGVCLSGNLTIDSTVNGYVQLGASEQIADATVFNFTANTFGRLQMQGFNETIGGVQDAGGTGTRILEAAGDTLGGKPATLTLNVTGASAYSYSGYVRDAASTNNSPISVIKTGTGTQTFSADNGLVNYSGSTVVSNGVLEFSGPNAVANLSTLTLYGGSIKFSGGGARSKFITGAGNVIKAGANTLTLSGTNNYTGATIVSNGVLNATTASTGAGSYAVADNATLGVAIASPGQSLNMSSLTLGSAAGPSTNNFTLGTVSPTAPVITNTGALTLNGAVTVNVSGTNLTGGTIVLLAYGSGGAGTFVAGTLPVQPGYAFSLTNDTAAKQLRLVVTELNPPLRWAVGDQNWDTSTPNWKSISGGGFITYVETNGVTFDDTNSGTSPITVTLTADHTPGGVTINSTKDYVLQGSAITGTAALTKKGTSMVILAGANTYTGGTTISGGKVALSGAGTLGNGSALTLSGGALDLGASSPTVGAVNLTGAAASGDTILNGSLTGTSYAASISTGDAIVSADLLANGTAGLVNNGPGTLTLSGNNTYTGGTVNNGGTLQLTAGSLGTGPVNINGGTFQVDGGTVNPATGANFNLKFSSCTNNQTAGVVDYAGYGQVLNSTLNLSGGTSHIGLEMMLGYGGANATVNFSGSHVANWYVTRLHGGNVTVNLLPGGALYSDEIYSIAATGVLKFNGGTLGMSALNPARRPGDWIYISGGSLTLYVENGGAIIDTAAGNATINLPLQQDGAATGGLTKVGANTLTLTGVNTYTGPTFIQGGALALRTNGSIAASSLISVTNGAVFNVAGLTVPLTLGSGQTLSNSAASTGTLNGSLDTGSGVVALSYDGSTPGLYLASGTLTLSAATTLAVDNTGAMLTNGVYQIITNAGVALITGTMPGTVTVGGGGAASAATLQVSAGGLYLVVGTFAPQISPQPVSLTRYVGGTATFTAGVVGSPAPTLRWQHNGGGITDATNQTLVLTNLQLTDAGSYVLTATNAIGGITSDTVTLTVLPVDSSPYLSTVLGHNPIGLWRFNDGGGTNAFDYVGGNNAFDTKYLDNYGSGPASLLAGPQPPTFPGFESTNTAPFMDGYSQGFASPVSLFNYRTNYTIMGWFNLDPAQYPVSADPFSHPQARTSLFGQSELVELGFYGPVTGTNLYFFSHGINHTIFVTNGFAPGQWEYVAVVADATANTTTFYLNGVVVGTATAGTAFATTNLFSIGKNVTYPIWRESGFDTAFFPGSIDEVAVFDYPLSASAIEAIYQVGTGTASAVAPTNVVAQIVNLSGVMNVILTGSGGSGTAGYTVLTTTNLTTPLADWTTNVTGVPFGAGGSVNYTNPVNPANPELFYRIRIP